LQILPETYSAQRDQVIHHAAKKGETMSENSTENKVKFFDGVKAEFKKISWPDPSSLGKQTAAVIVISVIVGALIAVLDMAFQYGFNFISSIG